MNDVYSTRPLKRKKCKIGFVEINGVCVSMKDLKDRNKKYNIPQPNPKPNPYPNPLPPRPQPSYNHQPRSSDLGIHLLEGLAVAGTVGGAGYTAYRNRGAIQRNYRRLTQPKVKTDEEMGLLSEEEEFFREQQERTGTRVREQQGIRNRRNPRRNPNERGTYEEQTPLLREGGDYEMRTRQIKNTTESEGSFFGDVDIESSETDSLIRDIERRSKQSDSDELINMEEGGVEETKEGVEVEETKEITFGLDGGAPEKVQLEPITEEELEAMTSKTGLIDDIIATQPQDEIPVATDGFIDSAIAVNEEAVIGADIAVGSAATITETAALIAPELAVALVVGGVAYGLEKGIEKTFDVGAEQDKKYSDKRNKQLGTHEMDKREIDYKMRELNAAKKYYQDQVDHMNFGDSDASREQHEKDKAMLDSINKSIDAIRNQQQTGEPVYSVVTMGFDEDNLSTKNKKEYDRLQKQVDDQQDKVNYNNGSKEKLAKREKKLDDFKAEHSNTPISSGFVNKPTDEEMQQITKEYVENGGDVFDDMDMQTMEALGITEAINSDEVKMDRMVVEETAKNEQTTDDVASSQGLYVPSARESGQM